MKIYTTKYIVDYARENCPYYKELYKNVHNDWKLEDLPLLDQDDYWNSEYSRLTGEQMDGQVFKSGGTTGEPKYSFYTSEEWETLTTLVGRVMPEGGLKYGDRIANLFYGGGLYGSFLFAYTCFCKSPATVLQYNLSSNVEIKEMVYTIVRHKLNAIAGLPSIITQIVNYIEDNKIEGVELDTIYFAGETLYPETRKKICKKLGREIDFRSMSYASNDGGIIGFYHKDCGFNEHRVMDSMCIVELIDEETGEVITEKDREGKVYITTLYRKLMPMIRYPAGDRAVFTEDPGTPNRKFRLLGRSSEAARVAYATVYPGDVESVLNNVGADYDSIQMIIERHDEKDGLIIRLGSSNDQPHLNDKILEELEKIRPILKEVETKNLAHKTQIVWCRLNELEYNKRTGKLKRIIDKRL